MDRARDIRDVAHIVLRVTKNRVGLRRYSCCDADLCVRNICSGCEQVKARMRFLAAYRKVRRGEIFLRIWREYERDAKGVKVHDGL